MADPVADAVAAAYKAYLDQYVFTVVNEIRLLPRALAELIANYTPVYADAFRRMVAAKGVECYIQSSVIHNLYMIRMDYSGLHIESWLLSPTYHPVAASTYMSDIRNECNRLRLYGQPDHIEVANRFAASYNATAQKVIFELLSTRNV